MDEDEDDDDEDDDDEEDDDEDEGMFFWAVDDLISSQRFKWFDSKAKKLH